MSSPTRAGVPVPPGGHVPPDTLAAFLGGRLDGPAAEAVAAHVGACADCAALLDEVPDGPVEQLLRATVPDPDATARGGPAAAAGPGAVPGGASPAVPGYEILGELGRGGMGVVYKARQRGLGRVVALKVIRGGPDRPELQARLRGEAEALARLKHPQIVQVYEAGWHCGEPYFVLEYVAGGSLAAHLEAAQRGGALALTPARSAALVEGLARAMHHAHGQGVVHRDLKPSNVLLEPGGAGPAADFNPKITDFGLAKLLGEGRADETRTGVILGTPGYLAPEQAEGRAKEVGPAADVYALGAVLYELVTGRPPFRGESVLDTLAQVRERDPVPPRRLQPRVPRDLETVCLTCLRKDLRRRYATAEALADDLRRQREGRPVLARPASAWERGWKWARRNPGWAAVAAVSAAALAALLGGGLYYNRQLDAKAEAARLSAGEAGRQRDLALKAYNQLVYDVQEKLRAAPATQSLRRGLLTAAANGLREIAAGADDAAPDASRAAAHALLGAVEGELGDQDEALRQFDAGEAAAAAVLAADPDNLRARAALCQALNGRGLTVLRRDKPDEALPVLERLVGEADAWAARAPADPEARAAPIKARAELAYALVWRWDLKAAEPLLREAERRALAWRAEDPASVPALDTLDLVYDRLDGWCTASRDPAAALEYTAKKVAVNREMSRRSPDDVRHQTGLVIALGNLAANAQAAGRTDLYLEASRDALAKVADLAAADPDNVDVAGMHLIFLSNAGAASLELLHVDEARGRFAEADRLLRRLDAAGKLKGLPAYSVGVRNVVRAQLALCDLVPRALADPAAAAATPAVAPGALELCCRLHLKEGRPDAAAGAAEALAAFEPSDPELLFGKAGGLARCLEAFDAAPAPAKAACPRGRLAAAAADALSASVDHGFADLARLETDPSLRALRGSPGYRAAVEKLRKKKG